MNRSKRFGFGAARQWLCEPPEGGYQILIWSCLLCSFSCFWMYSRIVPASRPTVETKNPLAQKCSPAKFLCFPPNTRAMDRALALEPDHLRHRVLRRDRDQHVHVVCVQVPSSIRLSFCSASPLNTAPRFLRSSPNSALRRYFGMKTTWHLHSTSCGRGSHVVHLELPFVELERFTVVTRGHAATAIAPSPCKPSVVIKLLRALRSGCRWPPARPHAIPLSRLRGNSKRTTFHHRSHRTTWLPSVDSICYATGEPSDSHQSNRPATEPDTGRLFPTVTHAAAGSSPELEENGRDPPQGCYSGSLK